MTYRIGRQKEENKGLLRGNVIRTQLNNIMSYKCANFYCLSIIYTNLMFLLLVPSILFLHEIEHNYFEIRPLVVLHCLGGVYCVEEVGECLLDGMVKRGEGDPYVEV